MSIAEAEGNMESWNPEAYSYDDSFYDASSIGNPQCEAKGYTVKVVLMILVSMLGMFGNLVVIYIIVVLREHKKTITNMYVVQLAISDFIFMTVLPLKINEEVTGNFGMGNTVCKIYQTSRMMSYYASILFLTVMSLDRYVAINHAMGGWSVKLRNKSAVCVVSWLVWVVCLASVINVLVRSQISGCKCVYEPMTEYDAETIQNSTLAVEVTTTLALELSNDTTSGNYYEPSGSSSSGDDGIGSSGYDDVGEMSDYAESDYFSDYFASGDDSNCVFGQNQTIKIDIYANFIGAFLVPLLVIIVCYTKILLKISQPMQSGAKPNSSIAARKRVTKMVMALVSSFVVCWLPYHSFLLARIQGISITLEQCNRFNDAVVVLANFNSVLNPFLYTFLGTNFRSRWKEALAKTRAMHPSLGGSRTGDYKRGRSYTQKPDSNGGGGCGGGEGNSNSLTKHTAIPLQTMVCVVDSNS